MASNSSPTNSRTGSPIPGSQGISSATASPILGSQGMGPVQPPLPIQPPSSPPIIFPTKFDVDTIQEIIDGAKDLSLSDFQSLMGQLAGWLSVVNQFVRVEKDTVNSIYHYMAREEGNLSLPYTAAISKINPFRQTGTMIGLLTQKFKHQCPHFNFDTMSGSLSPIPVLLYKKTNLTDSGGLLLVSNQQAPSLSQYSEPNVKTFVNRLKLSLRLV